jgi:hypothetical protein
MVKRIASVGVVTVLLLAAAGDGFAGPPLGSGGGVGGVRGGFGSGAAINPTGSYGSGSYGSRGYGVSRGALGPRSPFNPPGSYDPARAFNPPSSYDRRTAINPRGSAFNPGEPAATPTRSPTQARPVSPPHRFDTGEPRDNR